MSRGWTWLTFWMILSWDFQPSWKNQWFRVEYFNQVEIISDFESIISTKFNQVELGWNCISEMKKHRFISLWKKDLYRLNLAKVRCGHLKRCTFCHSVLRRTVFSTIMIRKIMSYARLCFLSATPKGLKYQKIWKNSVEQWIYSAFI